MFKWELKKESIKKMAGYIFLALTIRWGIAEAYYIPSESMNPTLKTGDRIFVNKAKYGVRLPFTKQVIFETGEVHHGDVVVFRYPKDESTFYVKRVIGKPGDQVEIDKLGNVFVNGKMQSENFIARSSSAQFTEHSLTPFGPIQVPENNFFVLGDNRDNSADSRVWGFVPKENLIGKVAFKWFGWVD